MTGWTVLAGCGKTTLARENFEGPHVRQKPRLSGYLVHLVSLMQPNKRDRPNKPNNGLLMLADFFSILLEGGQRLMTISRATLPLGPKGF